MNALLEEQDTLVIPNGWGSTREKFKENVIRLIQDWKWQIDDNFKCEVIDANGCVVPFFPIFHAALPEHGVITEQEIYDILYSKFVWWAREAYQDAIRVEDGADHLGWYEKFLAWGLEQWLYSPDEIQLIRFDSDTPESYIRSWGEPDLIENYIEKFIHPCSQVPFVREKIGERAIDCCRGLCH